MTPRRKSPRPGKAITPRPLSEDDHDVMVALEKMGGELRVVAESVDTRLTKTEFQEFRGEVSERFTRIDHRFEQIDHRFEQIDHRFERIDERFTQIDHRFEEINEHLALVVGELRGLRKDVAGHAQASELRALDQRVTALERRVGS